MHHQKKTSPQDFFLNISAFGSFACVLVSFGVILFSAVDFMLLGMNDDLRLNFVNAIAFFVAMLPTCIALFAHIEKSYRQFPNRRGSMVRRWLLAATLFVSGVSVIFDLISLLAVVFQGGFAYTELIKPIIVGLMATGVFLLFLSEVRSLKQE